MSKVMIHPGTYESVRAAVDRAFALFPMELSGKRVLIKPNVLRASDANEGICTHPSVLRSVVEKVEILNPASIVVGDNPGLFNYGDNEESFEKSGLMEAAGRYYQNIGNEARKVDFNPDFMPTVSISRAVLDADVIISLPKFKTHGLTVITGAIKNSYGFLPGAQKAMLHKAAGSPKRFHEMVVDVFRLRVPDLFVVDAVVGMEGNGPASPDLRNVGLILASDNAVALDAVIATLMGCDPARLRFLQKAKQLGLGDYDLNAIEVVGELKPLANYKLPPLGGEAIINNPAIQEIIYSRTIVRPTADPELCTACGTCVDQCPVSALSMEDNLPRVDTDKCITCFCCQEMCPEKAIALS
ncbi:MAG: DUF362 domain-containing protein [Desulfomonile tiedjei]|uniref:DUF362 domain-containing protein n=1 Tax=Desulfomonile tiedjei TaxID=2358 RepID=A0A9D6Z392_9BACT|nr:DUF362 domain-containing protein [Desulfomonile tiedjei]